MVAVSLRVWRPSVGRAPRRNPRGPGHIKLRVLETPQARVDILPCALERGREHRRIARGFRCSTGGMGPDYERSVPKKADPAEDGARHNHIDNRLHKRIRRCCHEFAELRVNLVPGAIDKRLHGRLWDTTLRQRSVMGPGPARYAGECAQRARRVRNGG